MKTTTLRGILQALVAAGVGMLVYRAHVHPESPVAELSRTAYAVAEAALVTLAVLVLLYIGHRGLDELENRRNRRLLARGDEEELRARIRDNRSY